MISQQTELVTLTATSKCGAIRRFELEGDQGVFIGKSSNCGFQLDGQDLSDIHCRIAFEDGDLCVTDWMSDQGTRLNGQEISDCEKIGPSDRIQIGQHEITVTQGVVRATSDDAPAPVSMEERLAKQLGRDTETPSAATGACAPAAAETAPVAEVDDQPETRDEISSIGVSNSSTPESVDGDRACVAGTPSVDEASAVDPPAAELPISQPSPLEKQPESNSGGTDSGSTGFEAESMDFSSDFFDVEEEETYDRETVALLQAEIEDLQAALAQRDAEKSQEPQEDQVVQNVSEETDEVLERMQELIEEANRSDERVAILEEMLHAAEEANRSEIEERSQLEAWVGDIERRVGQREEEHTAELDALRARLDESATTQDRLQQQLRQAATGGTAPKHFEETLENLQQTNRQLQEELAETQKEYRSLQQRTEGQTEDLETSLRAERAALAQEQSKIARMRYELSSKLASIEELPKAENQADRETAHRIQTLREHLREIHEQEKKEEKEAGLATRLAKLWKRVEY